MEKIKDMCPKIVCQVEKLVLPKDFKSLLFITWKYRKLSGKTDLFSGEVKTNEIKYDIVVDVPEGENKNFEFTLNFKAVSGEISKIGECSVKMPIISDILNGYKCVRKIEAFYGNFELTFSFSIKYVDNKEAEIEMIYQKSEFINAVEDYAMIIRNMKPLIFNNEQALIAWGDKGVFDNSEKVLESDFLLDGKETIYGVRDNLNNLEKETERFSDLMTEAFSLLMKKKPCYITEDYEECDSYDGKHCLPLLGVIIANAMEHNDPNIESLSFSLVTLCNSFADFLKSSNISTDWILCISISAFFVAAYVKVNNLKEFNVGVSFDTVGKHALIQYIKRIAEDFHNYCVYPNTLRDKINKQLSALRNIHFHSYFITKILDFWMENVDYVVTYSWIMTNDVYDDEILINFNAAFPNYQFDLINGLLVIIHFTDEIVNGTLSIDSVNPMFRGQWLADVLVKMSQEKGYNIDDAKSIPIKEAPSPNAPNAKELEENILFSEDRFLEIPAELPKKQP